MGAKGHRCGLRQRRHRTRRNGAIPSEPIRMAVDATPSMCPYSVRSSSPSPRRWFHTCSGEHAAILRDAHEGTEPCRYTFPTDEVFHVHGAIAHLPRCGMDTLRIAKDGCGLPTVSNTVSELAQIYAFLSDKDDDWIWEGWSAIQTWSGVQPPLIQPY